MKRLAEEEEHGRKKGKKELMPHHDGKNRGLPGFLLITQGSLHAPGPWR